LLLNPKMQLFPVIFGATMFYVIWYLQGLKYKTGTPSLVDDMVQNPLNYPGMLTEKELASNAMNYNYPNIPDRESNLTNSGFKPTDVHGVQEFFSEKLGPDFYEGRFPFTKHNDPLLGNIGVYTESIGQRANPAFEPRNINV